MRTLQKMYDETCSSMQIPKEILKGTLEGADLGLSVTHAIPRIERICREDDIKNSISRGIPRLIFSFGAAGSSAYVYYNLFNKYGSEVLAIPLVTNLVSLIYESYRRNREKVREEPHILWPGAT